MTILKERKKFLKLPLSTIQSYMRLRKEDCVFLIVFQFPFAPKCDPPSPELWFLPLFHKSPPKDRTPKRTGPFSGT